MKKLAYFPGCSLLGMEKEYNRSVIRAGEYLELNLEELPGWVCCGASSAHSLDAVLGLALPGQSLIKAQALEQDLLITSCAACYSRLREAAHQLKGDSEFSRQAGKLLGAEFKGKVSVQHFLYYIVEELGLEKVKEKVKNPLGDLPLACYYGCLMVRPLELTGKKSSENPRQLEDLIAALGGKAVNWYHKTECCGAGLALARTDIVVKLSGELIKRAKAAGAKAIVTACPLCFANLELRQKEIGENLPVFYFTELMLLAFGENRQKIFSAHLVNPEPILAKG